MKSFKWIFYVLIAAVFMMASVSCKKILDVKPKQTLDKEQTYRNVFDADAAVWGVYGKFMNLAKQYVILNELRADLLEYTNNADQYLRQISTHTVTEDNPYINPQPFYDVILNCNDVLKNFDQMLQDKKMKQDEYAQRYSDILAIRSWVYLQLGIHYGSVPYVTDALEQVSDLHDQTKFPKVLFKELLSKLIASMEAAPTLEEYPSSVSLRTSIDGYPTTKMFINKHILMGELYLWNGDYQKAATQYKQVMEFGTNNPSSLDLLDLYKIRYADVANNNDIAVGYIRYQETNLNALVDDNTKGWRSMFYLPVSDRNPAAWEWIWALPFDKDFAPRNPFIDLFSPVGGTYQLKPSQAAIDNWNSQTQRNGFPFDARGIFTYRIIGGQPVVMKYLYNYISADGFPLLTVNDRNGSWFLYRAATMHLHYAEAANRDGRHRLAWALVNNGINTTFDDPNNPDKTNSQQTHDAPPYDFMARSGGAPGTPTFTDPWYRGAGIRGRAYLTNLPVAGDSTLAIEDMIINEGALETAYEGHRWGDLLRVAIRRNDPSYLADKVYAKLQKDGVPNAAQARAKLMAGDWYLPFKWQ